MFEETTTPFQKSTTCSCQVTHWLALGDWIQALNIGNLGELSVQFDKQSGRNRVLFVFSFSEVGNVISAQMAGSSSYFQLPRL